jgi:hypothetical protein
MRVTTGVTNDILLVAQQIATNLASIAIECPHSLRLSGLSSSGQVAHILPTYPRASASMFRLVKRDRPHSRLVQALANRAVVTL